MKITVSSIVLTFVCLTTDHFCAANSRNLRVDEAKLDKLGKRHSLADEVQLVELESRHVRADKEKLIELSNGRSLAAGTLFPSGEFIIKSNGMCLDMDHNDGNVYFYNCHGEANQVWSYDTSTKQLKNADNGECLDLHPDNKNLYVYPCHGDWNQKFKLEGEAIQIADSSKNICMDHHPNTHNAYGFNCADWDNPNQKFMIQVRDYGSCESEGVSYTCETGYCDSNQLCSVYEYDGGDVCPFLESFDHQEETMEKTLSIGDHSSTLLQLPEELGLASNVIDFLIEELGLLDSANTFLLPTAVMKSDGETVPDVGADVEACEMLDIVDADVLAFGFALDGGQELCVAFNPCTHLYAISQAGIIPSITIAKILTVDINAIGFSLNRELVHESVNEMWNGGEVATMELPGHVYIAGTGSVGVKLTENIKATLVIEAELMIDADPNGDGVFQPLGDASSDSAVAVPANQIPSVDFALLASGTQSMVIEVKSKNLDFEIDLGGVIQSKKDLFIKVDGDFVEVQYASGVDLSLSGLCELSEVLEPICALFGDSGIKGRANAFFNTDGDFGIMLMLSGTFELDLSFGSEEVEEIMEDLFGGSGISFKASAQASMKLEDGRVELCLKLEHNKGVFDECLSFCKSDSECGGDSFCNPILGMCRPKRNNGFWPCLKDSQCHSDRCVDLTRVCEAKIQNGDACLADKACLSGFCGGAICGNRCDHDSDCPSGEWCNDIGRGGMCRPKRNDGWGPCLADKQCHSGRCVDTTRVCASKTKKGGACFASKECESGKCVWFKCR